MIRIWKYDFHGKKLFQEVVIISSFHEKTQKYDIQINRRGFLKFGAIAGILGLIPDKTYAAIAGKTGQTKPGQTKSPSRALFFYNLNTGEKLDVSYFVKGRYSKAALKDISYLFRDFRTGDIKSIDTDLLDYLHAISMKLETRSTPFHIISGYRSPSTNAMLSRESNNVARHSYHIQGKAVDIRLPDRGIRSIQKAAIAIQKGGVGYYPSDNFVHIDVGDVRYW